MSGFRIRFRPRFRVRALMAAVLMAALVMAAITARERALDRRRSRLIGARADRFGAVALELRWQARSLLDAAARRPEQREILTRVASRSWAVALWYAARAHRYRAAAQRPWAALPPDPPLPPGAGARPQITAFDRAAVRTIGSRASSRAASLGD